MTLAVALILPILNEAESLPALLHAIARQTLRPAEIIFVDAGSSDGSPAIIEAWWAEARWQDGQCRVLHNPGGMPGANRNLGIRNTQAEWIAFLDGGIEPEHDWLEQLCQFSQNNKARAVFGVCRFNAAPPFERAVCALSYGYESVHPVIPASLFHREVFAQVGFFPEHLRAAEDLFWVRKYVATCGPRIICDTALVHYRHFPANWSAVFNKWRTNERHSIKAGVRTTQHIAYLIAFPALFGLLAILPSIGLPLFMMYLFARGLLDPIRRSQKRRWWGKHPEAALLAIALALVMDLAKFCGICQEWGRDCLRKIS